MDLKTIKTFKTIVRLGSFQRAAEELNYAQSTVTMHIKGLEAELGVVLLERGKKLQLTQAGLLLNEKADVLLKGFENLQSSIEDLVHGESGKIRLGVIEPAASYRIPSILASFTEKFPKVELSIHIQNSEALSEMIKRDEIDLALCAAPDIHQGLSFNPIFSEDVVLLMPAYHPLTNRNSLRLKDIEGERMIAPNPFCPFRRILEKKMIEEGGVLAYGLEVNDVMALKYYVQSNFGMALVPSITVSPPPSGTVIRDIEGFHGGVTIGMMWKAERSYNGRAMEFLIKAINEGLGEDALVSV